MLTVECSLWKLMDTLGSTKKLSSGGVLRKLFLTKYLVLVVHHSQEYITRLPTHLSGNMANSGKEAVRLCERIVRQAFGDVVCVSFHFRSLEIQLIPACRFDPTQQR
jgi:hypothetical protein